MNQQPVAYHVIDHNGDVHVYHPHDVTVAYIDVDDDADGCGYCTHVWHDDNPCGGDTWAGICECPSSERA
jgi:hypothetical protein